MIIITMISLLMQMLVMSSITWSGIVREHPASKNLPHQGDHVTNQVLVHYDIIPRIFGEPPGFTCRESIGN